MPGRKSGWPDYWNYRERQNSFNEEGEDIEMEVFEPSSTSSPVECFAEDARCAVDARPSLRFPRIHIQHVEGPVVAEAPTLSYSKICTILDERGQPPSKAEKQDPGVADLKQPSAGATRLHVDTISGRVCPGLRADGTLKMWDGLAGSELKLCASPRKYCLRCGKKDHELKGCTWFPRATLPPVKQIGFSPAWKR